MSPPPRPFFSVAERDRVHEHVLELAGADERIVAGAVVGGAALGEGDRWSDVDLTFGVTNGVPVLDVLDDWTRELGGELGAVHLFDRPARSSIYRVFLLPGCLQVDLSCTPAADFGPRGPRFALLFGSAVQHPSLAPEADEVFGEGVHHAVRARFSIERGRWWQAEYWIGGVRAQALMLACLRLGVDWRPGRGYDDLPDDVLGPLTGARVQSLERDELSRALAVAVDVLAREAGDARGLAVRLEERLRELTAT